MAQDPERITILSKEFSAAAFEFHRGRMAEKGFEMEGSIVPRVFQIIEGVQPPKDMFNGEAYYAVTFRRKDD